MYNTKKEQILIIQLHTLGQLTLLMNHFTVWIHGKNINKILFVVDFVNA